jgi:uncharacterized membrane protein YeaQ/YmgE (transglycosylase-associated protein family)
MDVMFILGWLLHFGVTLVFGAGLALLGTSMMGRCRHGLRGDIAASIIGAVIGFFIFYIISYPITHDMNIWSYWVSAVGSVVVMGLYRLVLWARPVQE